MAKRGLRRGLTQGVPAQLVTHLPDQREGSGLRVEGGGVQVQVQSLGSRAEAGVPSKLVADLADQREEGAGRRPARGVSRPHRAHGGGLEMRDPREGFRVQASGIG